MNIDLSTESGYNIACGMRGPGHDEEGNFCATDKHAMIRLVKWVLSARIRGMAEATSGHAGMVRCTPKLGDEPDFKRFVLSDATFENFLKGVKHVSRHYLYHIEMALEAIAALAPEYKAEADLLVKLVREARYDSHLNKMREHWNKLFPEDVHE